MERKEFVLNPQLETECLFLHISNYVPLCAIKQCKEELESCLTDLFKKIKINQEIANEQKCIVIKKVRLEPVSNRSLSDKINSALTAPRNRINIDELYEESDSMHNPYITKELMDQQIDSYYEKSSDDDNEEY